MEETWELQDWELLQNPETGLSIPSDSSETSRDFGELDEHEGIITSNYFALDSDKRFGKAVGGVGDLAEEGSIHSENPSWVDPSYGFQRKNSSEFWSDSGSDGSGPQKMKDFGGKGEGKNEEFGDFKGKSLDFVNYEAKQELGIGEDDKRELGFGGNQEIEGFEGENLDIGKFCPDSGREDAKREVGFERIEEVGAMKGKQLDFAELWLESRRNSLTIGKAGGVGSEVNSNYGEMVHGWELSLGKEVVSESKSDAGLLDVKGGLGSETCEEIGELKENFEDFSKFWSDPGADTLVPVKMEGVSGDSSSGSGEMVDGSESVRDIVESGRGDGLASVEIVGASKGELSCENIEKSDEVQKKIVDSIEIKSDMGSETSAQGVTGGAEEVGDLGSGEKGDGLEPGSAVEAGGEELESDELVEGGRGAAMDERAIESGEGVGEKKRMVWWKLPFELLKFCVFRVSPVWSISIAAAVLGFVMLGRRLSRMKKKSRIIPLKITVEDKKVSQFMIRATRLNEAFSVVRRVPIIRPSLPATGATPWPVMSLR